MKRIYLATGLVTGLLCSLALAATVDGDWSMSLTAPEGATYFNMTIEVDGENATGYVGEALFSGTYKEGMLNLTGDYYVSEAGYISVLNMEMALDGEQLKGLASWDVYTADVLGKRPE